MFIGVFFLLTIATANSAGDVDPNLVAHAQRLGAHGMQLVSRVIGPAILPHVFFILRINFFAAWMAVLIAEGTGVTYGLGLLFAQARGTSNRVQALALMAVIGIVGFAVDFLLR